MTGAEREELLTLALARCSNALGHLASEAAWQQACKKSGASSLRRGVQASLAELLQLLEGTDDPLTFITGTVDHGALQQRLIGLHGNLEIWSDARTDAPTEVIEDARRALELLGFPEPEDGWESLKPDQV